MLPDFLIIGAARCGTTSLYEYMIKHPNIEPCKVKETYFFSRYFDRGLNWYRSLFPSELKKFYVKKILGRKFITGEASPLYLHYPHTPKRVSKIIPNVKLIVLLRNPIDRAYSWHYHRWKNAKTETLSFEEAAQQENSLINGEMEKMEKNENYYSEDIFYAHAYFTTGIYVDQLKRWFNYFPREQFLIIKSEDFFSNTPLIMDKLYNFLDLPKHRLNNYDKFFSSMIGDQILNPNTRKKLAEYFKPHNERLYDLIGINFHWEE